MPDHPLRLTPPFASVSPDGRVLDSSFYVFAVPIAGVRVFSLLLSEVEFLVLGDLRPMRKDVSPHLFFRQHFGEIALVFATF